MKKIYTILGLIIIAMLVVAGCNPRVPNPLNLGDENLDLKRFSSLEEIEDAFGSIEGQGMGGMRDMVLSAGTGMKAMAETASAPQATNDVGGADYSETNTQVEGVDEADIVKTNGKFIYTLSGNTLNIVEAYPAEDAELVSYIEFENFYANEFFISENKLIIFGSASYRGKPVIIEDGEELSEMPYRPMTNFLEARIYDLSNIAEPEIIKTVDVEGSYVSSRMIGDYVYYAVSTYPYSDHIIPYLAIDGAEPVDLVEPKQVGYFEPMIAESFISIIALPVDGSDISKEVIVGSGQNMYVSLENMYIAQSKYSWSSEGTEETYIYKLELDDGDIDYEASGSVPGTILNQFSMDEYDEHFRIATTIRGYSNNVDTSYNNMYILDDDLAVVGEIEDIAPGESIYSVRFMGKRAYMVTFKHVDPLFVIDLADPENPEILGKLKIPGYSDYLHPLDETHLIGIGKEVDASIDADKIHTEGAVYYTAIQGVKLAVFDVSDVSNPVEMYKEVIGDRGTESEAAHNHKALLFDKEKELLIIPITVAELQDGQPENAQGEFTFQGAYVYNLNLEDGFDLRGRVSHIGDESVYDKSGYRLGGYNSHVRRALYIGDVLYTISNSKIKMNDLDDLDFLNEVDLEFAEENHRVY